ncbi:MAG: HlyD family secretion protein [Rubrivivax sp.]|nr:HlyD family secretion protein [Rubrivivax sp.]
MNLRRAGRWLALSAALLLAAALAHRLWLTLSVVSTDNAQIESRIVPVLARVGGIVTQLAVDDHQRVTAGAALLQLDDAPLRLALRQAEAELALAEAATRHEGTGGQAQAQFSAARATAAAARAAIESAQSVADQAAAQLARQQALMDKGMTTQQAVDAAAAELRTARAELEVQRRRSESAEAQAQASGAGVGAARARVAAALAARDLAALRVTEAQVLAPAGGVISQRAVSAGQVVRAGQQLMSLVLDQDLWIVANFKETELRHLGPGRPAQVEVDAYPGLRLAAVVESISPATGARFSLLPPDNATGNFTKVVQRVPVRLRLTESPPSAQPLRPGLSVRVTLKPVG